MRRLATLFLLAFLLVPGPARAGGPGDRLYQVSVLPALLAGDYEGATDVAGLLAHGDFGLGTWQDLDGEMVVLDGKAYRVPASGRVVQAAPSDRVPFAAVAFFRSQRSVTLSAVSLKDLEERIDALLPSKNHFYALRLDGRMERLRARSVPRQARPWPPLAEVVGKQTLFTLDGLDGTLVGLRCPAFAAGINVPGYHWHFLSADHTRGGHVLDCAFRSLELRLDELPGLELALPVDAGFRALDLAGDVSAQVRKVEKAPGQGD